MSKSLIILAGAAAILGALVSPASAVVSCQTFAAQAVALANQNVA